MICAVQLLGYLLHFEQASLLPKEAEKVNQALDSVIDCIHRSKPELDTENSKASLKLHIVSFWVLAEQECPRELIESRGPVIVSACCRGLQST